MKKYCARVLSVVLVLAVAFSYSLTMGAGSRAAKKGKNKKVKSVAVTNITGKKLVLGKGKKLKLKVKVTLAAGSRASKKVTYKSSKPAVVSVTKKGVLKGRKIGSAKISVISKSDPGKKFVFRVNVKKKNQSVTKITLDKTELTLDLGEADEYEDDYVTYRLKAVVTPKTATNQTLKWFSSNTAAAVVNSEGLVTARVAGVTIITVKAADGSGKKATCKVTVVDDESDDDEDDEDEEDGEDGWDDDEGDDEDDIWDEEDEDEEY